MIKKITLWFDSRTSPCTRRFVLKIRSSATAITSDVPNEIVDSMLSARLWPLYFILLFFRSPWEGVKGDMVSLENNKIHNKKNSFIKS